jgi:hypothetical protein
MVHAHSPLEVVQQMFTKLGARYIVVMNTNGFCTPDLHSRGTEADHINL